MKILVFGSTGLVGKSVFDELSSRHEVLGTRRDGSGKVYDVDLTDAQSVANVMKEFKPDVIINCAGIVENTEKAEQNVAFTTNILEQVVSTKTKPKRIIILGSAGEYGAIESNELPVKESTPLRATSPYGVSKVKETTIALKYQEEFGLPIVVARLFNQIGPGGNRRFLISRILEQLAEIKAGKREAVEVNRLDAERDYLDVRDLARAITLLVEGDPREAVYNIGSGKSTSNGAVVELVVRKSKLGIVPRIVETQAEKEPLAASQADISRMHEEFGWEPEYSLEATVEDIVNEAE